MTVITIMLLLAIAAGLVSLVWALPGIITAFRTNLDESRAERYKRIVYREVQMLNSIEVSNPRRMRLEIDISADKLEREILED